MERIDKKAIHYRLHKKKQTSVPYISWKRIANTSQCKATC